MEMKLNYITNGNKNLQEKMRFFGDYFSFANDFFWQLPDIPFDNPLSLVSKAIFQIENNFDYCLSYISSYLSLLFVFHTNSFEIPDQTLVELENQFK